MKERIFKSILAGALVTGMTLQASAENTKAFNITNYQKEILKAALRLAIADAARAMLDKKGKPLKVDSIAPMTHQFNASVSILASPDIVKENYRKWGKGKKLDQLKRSGLSVAHFYNSEIILDRNINTGTLSYVDTGIATKFFTVENPFGKKKVYVIIPTQKQEITETKTSKLAVLGEFAERYCTPLPDSFAKRKLGVEAVYANISILLDFNKIKITQKGKRTNVYFKLNAPESGFIINCIALPPLERSPLGGKNALRTYTAYNKKFKKLPPRLIPGSNKIVLAKDLNVESEYNFNFKLPFGKAKGVNLSLLKQVEKDIERAYAK